ncbi:hypothetical protein KSS93_21215 [Pseudomonas xanthosomatis]|uniref:hypothetical protein n=1 Tax=Pseudomonas xanthosomatis TaxID=2842356 RepID=UPI001C3D7BDA|nr:hypothetical protein [Pseudomonas xanthosomatis]QXH45375.1 hypothetical protein KSS93_21215 [Pseudomonas xanthosomatis]
MKIQNAAASKAFDANLAANDDARIQQIMELHLTGMSRRNIAASTGATEHFVRKITQGVPVVKQQPRTTFEKSAAQVYELATRGQGIKDYELRSILHHEYGCAWNHSEGLYKSLYDQDTIKRVKTKVREQATTSGQEAKFIPDWIDNSAPTASRVTLEQAASVLSSRLDELMDEFMFEFSSNENTDSVSKQRFAARRHVLKLVSGLGQEPVSTLLERTKNITDVLDGYVDSPAPKRVAGQLAVDRFIPEPNTHDYFLDFVEEQGWLKSAA